MTCESGTQFTCDNGRCVEMAWRCDGDNDCLDMSDEIDCDHSSVSGRSCRSYEFKCTIIPECIHKAWLCDGDFDCQDHSDENITLCKCLLAFNIIYLFSIFIISELFFAFMILRYLCYSLISFPSLLGCCWFGIRKGISPVKSCCSNPNPNPSSQLSLLSL